MAFSLPRPLTRRRNGNEMKMKPFSNNHSRRLVPVLLTAAMLLGLFLPFVFIRTAFLVLESAAICTSTIGCVRWRFFGGTEALLREELTRALLEATNSNDDGGGFGVGIGAEEDSNSDQVSFENLVKEMASNRQDMKAFAFMTKAMIMKMERNVRKAKWQESIYWHLAAHGAPKSLNCLSLNLAEEYAVNSIARARLPLPQYVYRLTDPSFHHVVLLTDNVLAASVVISSTIKESINPQNLVFHVVTDKKTYTSMHAYFAVNLVDSAVVEVKGLHQYDWSSKVNIGIEKMLDIHRQIWDHNYRNLKTGNDIHKLDFLSSSSISLLNHIRVYLPELFPDLDKVVFLDDDIVVQRDLSSLWNLNLNQKVMGAVVDSWCGQNCCPGRKYKDYFNFSHPIISSNLDQVRCGFLYGMNVFDLKQWRKTNITAVYHQWLKHSVDCGFTLWHPGALAPALIAFESHVHRLGHSWHVAGLGQRHPLVNKREVKAAVTIHFSGPAKPWLEIASPEVRGLWNRHLNLSNEYIRKCGITV